MPWSFATLSSSFAFLSSSKKNRASESRARITLSLPFVIVGTSSAVLRTAT